MLVSLSLYLVLTFSTSWRSFGLWLTTDWRFRIHRSMAEGERETFSLEGKGDLLITNEDLLD
jgi:hypothetical protein